jgi:PAS domain S-box-containing protein
MQHVKLSWLRAFNYSLVGVSAVLGAAYLTFEYLNVSEATKDYWGITPLILLLAAIHAAFVFVSDRLFFRRIPWLTVVISIALYGFLCSSIIESSGNVNIAYRVLLGIVVFFSAMIGPIPPTVSVVFIWLILILTVTGVATETNASLTFNLLADGGITIAAILGWLTFRKRYILESDSEKKKLVEAIEEEQFKASLILESIVDGVIIIDPAGTVQLINKSASELIGWPKEEASGITYLSLMDPLQEGNQADPPPPNPITTTLETQKTTKYVGLFKTRAKDSVYFDILASPILKEKDDAESGVIVVFRDVSAARAEEKARAEFISTASHEMRTPVAAIEGYLALALNEKVSKVDANAKQYLLKAHRNTQHLGELFQDLLTTTRAEDGRLSNTPELVEMGELIQQLTNDLRFIAEKKGIQVHFNIGESSTGEKVIKPLYYVMVDPARMNEVFSNLFDNAVKYTDTGGSITVGLTGDKDVVQYSVTDTGHGIPETDIKHLFQKFYRVDTSETRTIGGTGLGLFICRKIIELYSGRIWVNSEIGKGSTFYVNLPRLSSQQASKWKAEHPAPAVPQPTANPVPATAAPATPVAGNVIKPVAKT